MAQNFASTAFQIGTSTTALFTNASSSPVSSDAVIGIRVANILANAITINVWVSPAASGQFYIAKNLSIPPNSSVELVQGGAKFVLNDTDVLNASASENTAADVITSVVKAISTAS